MVIKHVGAGGAPSRELEGIRESLRDSFFTVGSRTVPVEEMPGARPELSACHKRLLGAVRDSGWSAALEVCPSGEALISRGVDYGSIRGSVVDYTQDLGAAWKATPIHLARQERSPKIMLSRMEGETPVYVERKIKGGGVREHAGSRLPYGSSRQFIHANEGVVCPFAVNGRLMTRSGENWMMEPTPYSSLSIWGAASRSETEAEFVSMLGVHQLMMSVDGGNPAGAHVPVSVEELTHVPVVRGGVLSEVPVADYLTNPEIHSIKDLMLLAYWAQDAARTQGLPKKEKEAVNAYVTALEENDIFHNKRRSFSSNRYLSALPEEEIAGMEGARPFDKEAKKRIAPTAAAAGAAMAKTFRFAQLQSVGGDDVRIQEMLDHVTYDSASKEDVDTALKVIYANYGEELKLPDDGPQITPVPKEMPAGIVEKENAVKAYLKRVYELNRDAASRILERFTRNFFRDIGALHGAGGYFGGFQPPMGAGIPLEEYGAPMGGSVECRNTDILGCKHDLADAVYVPHIKTHQKPPEETIKEMQLKDLYLAEVTLGKFNTLLTGNAENNIQFTLADNRQPVYTGISLWGSSDRVGKVRSMLSYLRDGTGPVPQTYSEHFRRLQKIREEVYQDFYERGREFSEGLSADSRATQDTA